MREIQLTKGQVTIVDDEDYDDLSKHKWKALWIKETNSFRACRWIMGFPIRMNRVLMKPPKGRHVKYINGDTLDNRKENLRLGSDEVMRIRVAVNRYIKNSEPASNNTSGYKGVSWHKNRNIWVAHITQNKKQIHLGSFDCPKKAYEARCEAFNKQTRSSK